MATTYFHQTKRDDGSPITVKYSFRNTGGSGCDRIVAQIAEHHED